MKSICLIFRSALPFSHRRYRFFDIGNDHYYYDDYSNETDTLKVSQTCFKPSGKLFRKLIEKHKGKFRFSLSFSGPSIDLLEIYSPEVLKEFIDFGGTGCVEFLGSPRADSLSSLAGRELFEEQVKQYQEMAVSLFGQSPKVFLNTGMVYSDVTGAALAEMGFTGVIAEGARHILGWKSPNFLYCNVINPRLKILMRNYKLSDDLTFRFSNTSWSEYPLTAEKFITWLKKLPSSEELVNLVIPFETLGILQPKDIFTFFEKFVDLVIKEGTLRFVTPSEAVSGIQPVSAVSVPGPTSWAGEERDLSVWLGNDLQQEAFRKLYDLTQRVAQCPLPEIQRDWNYLQGADHFRLMATRQGEGFIPETNHFGSPYEAFINYMNILSDFKNRLEIQVPENQNEKEISILKKTIKEKDARIEKYRQQVSALKSQIKPLLKGKP